jgi:hypothetical protein
MAQIMKIIFCLHVEEVASAAPYLSSPVSFYFKTYLRAFVVNFKKIKKRIKVIIFERIIYVFY